MSRVLKSVPPTMAMALGTLLAGCAYPNQLRNTEKALPHASLTGQGVALTRINGQPTSFWRTREQFRIPPGPTTLAAVAGHWKILDFEEVRFNAEAGGQYVLSRQSNDGVEALALRDQDQRTLARVEARRDPGGN